MVFLLSPCPAEEFVDFLSLLVCPNSDGGPSCVADTTGGRFSILMESARGGGEECCEAGERGATRVLLIEEIDESTEGVDKQLGLLIRAGQDETVEDT